MDLVHEFPVIGWQLFPNCAAALSPCDMFPWWILQVAMPTLVQERSTNVTIWEPVQSNNVALMLEWAQVDKSLKGLPEISSTKIIKQKKKGKKYSNKEKKACRLLLIYCALASYIVNGVQMYFKLRKNLWNGYHSGATHLRQAAPFISLVCFCLNSDCLKIDAPGSILTIKHMWLMPGAAQ